MLVKFVNEKAVNHCLLRRIGKINQLHPAFDLFLSCVSHFALKILKRISVGINVSFSGF